MQYLFGLDEGFAMPTGVAAASLDRFLSVSDEITFFHLGLSPESESKLRSCVRNATARLVDCRSDLDPTWPTSSWLSPATYLRVLAQKLLDDSSLCLYLDGDVVVRRDPAPLCATDLQGCSLGAVRSRVAPFLASPGGVTEWFELGLPSTAPYFNAGVLLLDLERWRGRDVLGQVVRFLDVHGDRIQTADQEALNALLVGDWVEVDRTWNYVTHVSESFLPQPELEPDDPHIVHFAGRTKPWSPGTKPLFAEDWYELLASTPWAGFEPVPPPGATGLRRIIRQAAARPLRALRDVARS
jgi:lipopolysaccharide biosynthesis glycosyltransferase